MKFKGNKKLSIGKDKLKVLNDSGVLIIAHINNYGNESKYDALLFSKAYEVLELLEKCLKHMNVHSEESCKLHNEAKKLIKEATEI